MRKSTKQVAWPEIGAHYGVIRNGATVPVILKEIKQYRRETGSGSRTLTRYVCLNTISGRLITIKSASRLRSLNTSHRKHD